MKQRYTRSKMKFIGIFFIALLSTILFQVEEVSTSNHVSGSSKSSTTSTTNKCQEITIPMCKGIGYNLTELPNQFNHDTQEEAGMEVHQYWPLVEIKCSNDLKFFICSLYVPICMEDFIGTVPVCRSVCERARYGCEPVMIQYGFQWPERMKCERFPDYGTKKALCMDEKLGEMPPKEPNVITNLNTIGGVGKGHAKGSYSATPTGGGTGVTTIGHPIPPRSEIPSRAKCSCKDCHFPLVRIIGKDAFNNSGILIESNGVTDCGIPCNIFKTPDEVNFTKYWLLIWSSVCAFITFLTLLTFIIDPVRFKYPERPIVYLSTCYLLVSTGYLIRLYKGHEEIACKGGMIRYNIEVGASSSPAAGTSWGCTLVFLLIYYFGMASSIWWVVLSMTWYLAAGCKWGSEAIAAHSHLFHVVAWVLPALTTLTAILEGAVDGDPVSGICFIGNQDPLRLTMYIIVPLGLLLILGTSFLLAGFFALVRIRRVLTKQVGRSKTEKLEKLMIRIGIFSILYTLPASAVIAAYLYEITAKKEWLEDITCNCSGSNSKVEKPIYSILMLKYFMSLAVGITSGVWIWSGKTVDSWKKFLNRLCCRSRGTSGIKYTSAVYHQPTNNTNGKNLTHV